MNSFLKKIEIKPLNVCLEQLKEEGFVKYFSINENGLHEINSDIYYKPGEFKVSNLFKLEWDGNRSDDPILYAIETIDGVKGVLSNVLQNVKRA